jgi:hypothetical protein
MMNFLPLIAVPLTPLLVMLVLGMAAGAQNTPNAAAPVTVQPFNVALTAQDGQNINQLCVFAMDNKALDIQTRTAVGQFCIDLLNRVGKAQQAGTQGAQSAPATTNVPNTAPAPQEERK